MLRRGRAPIDPRLPRPECDRGLLCRAARTPASRRMTVPGQSRLGRASCKPGHVHYAAESGSKFRALMKQRRALRVDGAARDVIQSPKLEPRSLLPIQPNAPLANAQTAARDAMIAMRSFSAAAAVL